MVEGAAMTPLRVLLVDDELLNREIGRAMLAALGHTVRVATSGAEALALCHAEPVDLVLMDVQMPGLDGFATAACLRTEHPDVRIVALTGATTAGDRARCRAAGMDGHLGKPLQRDALARTVGDLFGPSAPAPELDVAAVLEQVHGDMALLRTLAGIFREQSRSLLAEGRQALGRGDAKALDGAAHALKSVVGHFSTGEAFEHARQVEELAHAGHVAGLGDRWHALEREIERMRTALDALGPARPGKDAER